ncbi:unnamed protein product [Boreogadus saida]
MTVKPRRSRAAGDQRRFSRRDRRETRAPMTTFLPRPATPILNPAPARLPEEPMELGRLRLSREERSRRLQRGLCMYCGSSGHQVQHCPDLQGKDSTRQGTQGNYTLFTTTTTTPQDPVVLGYPWLAVHEPQFAWAVGSLLHWGPACATAGHLPAQPLTPPGVSHVTIEEEFAGTSFPTTVSPVRRESRGRDIPPVANSRRQTPTSREPQSGERGTPGQEAPGGEKEATDPQTGPSRVEERTTTRKQTPWSEPHGGHVDHVSSDPLFLTILTRLYYRLECLLPYEINRSLRLWTLISCLVLTCDFASKDVVLLPAWQPGHWTFFIYAQRTCSPLQETLSVQNAHAYCLRRQI